MRGGRLVVDVSRREKEKAKSLDALSKFAYASSAPLPAPKPSAAAPASRARPPPRPSPPPSPSPYLETDADRARRKQMEERRAKLDEERALRARREGELARGSNLQWRGGGFTDIPASIRRTAFDRQEPNLHQKLADVLGEVKEKESRAKNREKGKRQGGR